MDKQKEKAIELSKNFSNFVNNYNHDAEGFVDAFCREHRTLQQSGFRLMLQVIERIASDEYTFDGRNKSAHETAALLMEAFKEKIIAREIEMGSTEITAKRYAESDYCKPHKFLPYI